jgi:hypothetical protein
MFGSQNTKYERIKTIYFFGEKIDAGVAYAFIKTEKYAANSFYARRFSFSVFPSVCPPVLLSFSPIVFLSECLSVRLSFSLIVLLSEYPSI